MMEYKKTLVVFTSCDKMCAVMPLQEGSLDRMYPEELFGDEINNSWNICQVERRRKLISVDKIELNGVYLVRDSIDAETFRRAIGSINDEEKEQVHVLYHKNKGGGGFDNEMLQGFKAYLGQHTYGPTYGYPSFLKALSELGDNQECRGSVVDELIQATFCYNARIDTALDFLHKCLTAEPKTINLEEMLKKIGIEEPEQGEIRRLLDKRAEDDQWLRKVRDIVLAKVMHA